jgi:tetratricopeptide (TPR) repeat protein
VFGALGIGRALSKLGRLEEASLVLAAAVSESPSTGHLWHDLAHVMLAQKDWPGSELCWRRFISIFPEHVEAHLHLAQVLREQCHFQEAIRILTNYHERAGRDQFMVLSEIANLYCREGKASFAYEFVEQQREVFNTNPEFSVLMHDLSLRRIDEELSAAVRPADEEIMNWMRASKKLPESTGSDIDGLLRFESLGGIAGGCEFAAVQSGLGASPLSLLRWAGMEFSTLVKLLEGEFQGFGETDNIQIGFFSSQLSQSNREYAITDLAFGTVLHSHVRERDADMDSFRRTLTRRLTYLRDKLLSDLKQGEKIFVFKHSIRKLDAAELDRLSAALHQYGNVNLLLVFDVRHFPTDGIPELIRPHVWAGSLDFSSNFEDQRVEAWQQLCAVALNTIPCAVD